MDSCPPEFVDSSVNDSGLGRTDTSAESAIHPTRDSSSPVDDYYSSSNHSPHFSDEEVRISRQYSDEQETEMGGNPEYFDDEDEEYEEEDVADLYNNPENLKVEYLGKHRMTVVDQIVDDSFLVTDEPGAVPRLIVIDAANILHGFTPEAVSTSAAPPGMTKVDAAYILSLVRFFVSKGFECMVVTQHKYIMDNVTEHMFIIRALHEQGLIMVMDGTYDDYVLFDVASEFDAVILSEDQFRNERQDAEFLTPNVKRALQLRVSPIYPRISGDFLPKSEWGKVSRNGHFVVDHLLRFEGTTEHLRAKFFSSPSRGGHRFELVQEKYESWLKRKDQVLSVCDHLLAQIQPIMEKKRQHVAELLPRGN